MSNFTVVINFDSKPSEVSWRIENSSATSIVPTVRNDPFDESIQPNSQVTQQFQLSANFSFLFIIEDLASNGISCGRPPCFYLYLSNITQQIPLIEGSGKFACAERYNITSDNIAPNQSPIFSGCNNSDQLLFKLTFAFLGMVGLIVLAISFRMHFVERRFARRDTQAVQDQITAQQDWETVRKESMLAILPKKIFVRGNDDVIDLSISLTRACPICLEPFKTGDEICWSMNEDCTHIFHTTCILDWLLRHDVCPMCRSNFLAISSTAVNDGRDNLSHDNVRDVNHVINDDDHPNDVDATQNSSSSELQT